MLYLRLGLRLLERPLDFGTGSTILPLLLWGKNKNIMRVWKTHTIFFPTRWFKGSCGCLVYSYSTNDFHSLLWSTCWKKRTKQILKIHIESIVFFNTRLVDFQRKLQQLAELLSVIVPTQKDIMQGNKRRRRWLLCQQKWQ